MKAAIINARIKPESKVPNDKMIQTINEARANQNLTPLDISELKAMRSNAEPKMVSAYSMCFSNASKSTG